MLYILENSFIKVTFDSMGAEVKSVLQNGFEYMHQPNDSWNRTSPLLFPFVGCLTNNMYSFQGKNYPNLRHGFVRDMEFEICEKTQDEICFLLRSNDETKALYPFDFELYVRYSIACQTLITSYKVKNLSSYPMYYGLGTHPGFRTNYDNLNLSNFSIEFEMPENSYQLVTEDGLLNGELGYHLKSDYIMLEKDLFNVDSLLFPNLVSNKLALLNVKGSPIVEVEFDDFPYLCIWAPVGKEDLVCIEPWLSVVGKKGASIAIEDRDDMIKLESLESKTVMMKITYKL